MSSELLKVVCLAIKQFCDLSQVKKALDGCGSKLACYHIPMHQILLQLSQSGFPLGFSLGFSQGFSHPCPPEISEVRGSTVMIGSSCAFITFMATLLRNVSQSATIEESQTSKKQVQIQGACHVNADWVPLHTCDWHCCVSYNYIHRHRGCWFCACAM